MNQKVSLEFSVDNFEFEDFKDARFAKGTIHAFADGPNAKTHPISTEVLMECANSIYDIPLVCRYDGLVDDFLSHEADEVPIGFIKETSPTYSNPIIFEKNSEGQTFIVIKSLIWKKYAGEALRVFKESHGKKSVSVEITITKGDEYDGRIDVKEFILDGITILGDFVRPAVKNANIQLEFARAKEEYLNDLKFAENVGDTMEKEEVMQEETTVEMATEEGCTENYATEEVVGQKCSEEAVVTECSETAECSEKEDNDIGCSAEEGCTENCATEKSCTETCATEEPCVECANDESKEEDRYDDEHDDEDDKHDNKDDEHDHDDKYEEMSIEEAMCKIAEMSDKIAELETQNKAYMSEIESLKAFKCSVEEKAKQEENMSAMQAVMSEIIERGYAMSEEEKQEFTTKFSDFDSVTAWSNYVKAQVFDKTESTNTITQIGLPFANQPVHNSIWDRF